MRTRRHGRLLSACTALYCIGSAVVAHADALPFTPTITIGTTNLTDGTVTANADGSFTLLGHQQGGVAANGQPVWDIGWDLTIKQDPFIAGNLTITNLTTTTRNFNLTLSLPVTPAFTPSLFGGSIDATVRDRNNDGIAALAPIAISPSIYRGTIDGITVLSLFALNLNCSASGGGCSANGSDSDGLPGPALAGPAVNTSIGTFLNFSLSAGDSVTFATNFTVEPPSPVPLPAALPLLAVALGSLTLKRRGSRVA